ncbi:MAG: anhydro-N-acetylmuramic acid kinase [Bacteroidales bacterium]|nr:anhydro-N-acetylmuramic acid kinase [Bacteroidales bacterium]
MKNVIEAIGIMSGTSLDGLDLAWCRFENTNGNWVYRILNAGTITYPDEWRHKLSSLHTSDALTLSLVNTEFGHWIGEKCRIFINGEKKLPQLIASHGHTIFHRPDKKMTLQIGSGAAIAAETGIITVSDFRSMDVALGGNGAPLVPIGDNLLFGGYSACVNIGGFANLSWKKNGQRLAWDICPANFILNREAEKLGLNMDQSGMIARKGNMDQQLLDRMNELPFYRQPGPKSLGREWTETNLLPLIETSALPVESVLRTCTEHIAIQVSHALQAAEGGEALFTGGGAHNTFLMERIEALSPVKTVIPDKETVDFKEALIFALLGVLRLQEVNNCLAEVTGAIRNSCGGAVYIP